MVLTHSFVAIIGNGFDIHLGLKSKLKDFFEDSVYQKMDNKFVYIGNNLLYLLFYYRFFADGQYDYYVFRRVDNNDPTWMDVEGFLKKISTEEKIINFLYDIYMEVVDKYYQGNYINSQLSISVRNVLNQRDVSKSGANSVINKLLLNDLIEFENSFKEYLVSQVSINPNYNSKKEDFFKKIAYQSFDIDERVQLIASIYNFNYTSINSNIALETNVHGSLERNIVIGYDSTTDIANNRIYELSKDWQKTDIDSKTDLRAINANNILFYGHSLGEQDYPYFFEIFDSLGLLDSKSRTRLYFCYSEFGDEKEKQDFYIEYKMNISKLLNSYERYKNGSVDRNTIVTKLKSQGRLYIKKIID